MIRVWAPKSAADLEEGAALTDSAFDATHDPFQLQPTIKTVEEILAWCPKSVALLSENDTLLGFAFGWPTSEKSLNDFLYGSLTEQQLWDDSIGGNTRSSTFYLSAIVIKPAYQRRGLATKVATELLRRFPDVQTVGYWAYTREGGALMEKLKSVLPIEFKARA